MMRTVVYSLHDEVFQRGRPVVRSPKATDQICLAEQLPDDNDNAVKIPPRIPEPEGLDDPSTSMPLPRLTGW